MIATIEKLSFDLTDSALIGTHSSFLRLIFNIITEQKAYKRPKKPIMETIIAFSEK